MSVTRREDIVFIPGSVRVRFESDELAEKSRVLLAKLRESGMTDEEIEAAQKEVVEKHLKKTKKG